MKCIVLINKDFEDNGIPPFESSGHIFKIFDKGSLPKKGKPASILYIIPRGVFLQQHRLHQGSRAQQCHYLKDSKHQRHLPLHALGTKVPLEIYGKSLDPFQRGQPLRAKAMVPKLRTMAMVIISFFIVYVVVYLLIVELLNCCFWL